MKTGGFTVDRHPLWLQEVNTNPKMGFHWTQSETVDMTETAGMVQNKLVNWERNGIHNKHRMPQSFFTLHNFFI